MGNSDRTPPTTIPKISDRSLRNAQADRISLSGRRLARGRCSRLQNPVIRERQCRICQRRITWGYKRWYCEACRANLIQRRFNRRLISQRRAAGLCIRCGELAVEGADLLCSLPGARRGSDTSLAGSGPPHVSGSWKIGRRVRSARSARLRPQRGALRCQACLADSRARHRRDRARWRAAGLCVSCGRTPRRGVKVCGVCTEREKQAEGDESGGGLLSLRPVRDAWPEVLRGLSSCGEGVSAAAALEGHY